MEKYSQIIAYKKKILGIELLRAILCFWVVCFHCLKLKNRVLKKIIFKKTFHVPTFIIISFFMLFKNLNERNIIKIKRRFELLLIPYIVWPSIIWFISNLLFKIFKFNRFNRYLDLYDLIIQVIVGRNFLSVFWFYFNLIFLTVLFFIISIIYKNNFLFILQILGIFAYLIQYSEYNYYFFYHYKNTIKLSVGYFSEIIPIAVTGLTLSNIKIIDKLKNHIKKSIFFSIIIIYILFRFEIFKSIKGFTYRGI